jgi:hypothetical protein
MRLHGFLEFFLDASFADFARGGKSRFFLSRVFCSRCRAADSVQAAQRPQGLALTADEEKRSAVRCKRVYGLHRLHNAVGVAWILPCGAAA